MTISMYQASVPVLVNRLNALSQVLAKAEENATARKIDPKVFLSARLAPDMLTLTQQVQIASDNAKGIASRLAGREIPSYEDNETSFAELQERIAKTVRYLESFAPADIDGSEERPVEMRLRGGPVTFTGQQYLLNFGMPNFYFHVVAAYAILRHNGVPLGKPDFIGTI
jgi:uncharacterized protein